MKNSCGRTCEATNSSITKAGKLINGIVKITITAIVIFTIYQQFLR